MKMTPVVMASLLLLTGFAESKTIPLHLVRPPGSAPPVVEKRGPVPPGAKPPLEAFMGKWVGAVEQRYLMEKRTHRYPMEAYIERLEPGQHAGGVGYQSLNSCVTRLTFLYLLPAPDGRWWGHFLEEVVREQADGTFVPIRKKGCVSGMMAVSPAENGTLYYRWYIKYIDEVWAWSTLVRSDDSKEKESSHDKIPPVRPVPPDGSEDSRNLTAAPRRAGTR